jgi:hypothetical protein
MDVINTVGALAGVGAFVGVSVLAVLYFSQARDVRRLRDWAGRAPERAAQAEQALVAYEAGTAAPQAQPQTATEHQGDVAEQPAAAPAAVGAPMAPQGAPPQQPPQTREDWQIEAEAAADAELEQRRQQREQFGGYTTHKRGGLPEVNSPWIVLVGGAILIFAVIFGAIHVLGGGDGTETTSKGKKKGGGSPEVVKVAVLNGTAVPGLAAKVGDDVTSSGFKLGAVTNS